jgi:UPF0755 protein
MSEMSLSDVVLRHQEPGQPGGGRRSALRKQEKRRKRRRRRTILAIVLSVVIVGAAVGVAYVGLRPIVDRLTEPDDYTGAGTGTVQVKIAAGSSGAVIGGVLEQKGVVKTQKAFVDEVRLDTKRAGAIQPGTYQLKSQMSAAAALAALLDPTSRIKLSVTIPEGKRVPETLDILSKQLGLPRDGFEAAIRNPATIGLKTPTNGVSRPQDKVEGFLFPSTYDFEPDVTPVEVLKTMVAQTDKVLDAAGVPVARRHDVVTEASIIQAEARKYEDMQKVSRVLDNRLSGNIKLQLDSTVSYATNKFNVTTTNPDRASRSPYNTYVYFGLPRGPISSPGADAIKAAQNPVPGKWLYFVTVNPDTGETRFAVTKAEHDANTKIFQQWLRDHQ